MALTENQKNLLEVVKTYNANLDNGNVRRLVAKLNKDFGSSVASHLTGFTILEVEKYAANQEKVRGLSRKVVAEKVEESIEETISVNDESTGNLGRLAIHVNAESDLAQRIAYDISKQIEKRLSPGDQFWSRRELSEIFIDASSGTIQKAVTILVNHNWIERVDEKSPRHGFKVI